MRRVLAVGTLGGLAFSLSGATLALAASGLLVDGRPCSRLSLFFGNAALFVAFFDMLGFALLFLCVLGLVTSRHDVSPGSERWL